LPRAKKLSQIALGEEFFTESFFCSRQRNYSPRVLFFAENIIFYSHQRGLHREHEIKLSLKNISLAEASVSVAIVKKKYACPAIADEVPPMIVCSAVVPWGETTTAPRCCPADILHQYLIVFS
jgi:hypothetical protein